MPDNHILSNVRVLIVEDEYFIMDDLQRIVNSAGGSIVGPYGSLEENAFSEGTNNADIAVLDINMRGVMVFPLADALNESGVPFLFATGYDDAEIPERFRDVPRLGKPYVERQLIQALVNILPGSPAVRDDRRS